VNNVSLLLDLTEWVATQPRTYREAMTAWRTSCPKLTIWEDAIDGGLVRLHDGDGPERTVVVTPMGVAFMQANGRLASAEGCGLSQR
jgi:hypothetical protein